MLERAKACLKSRATGTSRCATSSISKSRRMLHSTFWTHGAEGLDIPPYAVSARPPSNLPLQHDTSSLSPSKTREPPTKHCQASDSVFLDFLYPPASLALLHRAKAGGPQQFERWEKRNARRLPDGFVQTTRGYASKSGDLDNSGHRRDAESVGVNGAQESRPTGEAVAEQGEGQSMPWEAPPPIADMRLSGNASRFKPIAASAGDLPELELNRAQESRPTGEAIPEQGERQSMLWEAPPPIANTRLSGNATRFKPIAASSGDLSELESSGGHDQGGPSEEKFGPTVPAPESVEYAQPSFDLNEVEGQGRKLLLNIISFSRDSIARMSPEAAERITSRAMHIFDNLEESNKSDPRLNSEVVSWLALAPETSKDARCMELYEQIPRSERTVPLYVAALSIYLRNDMWPKGVQLHKEAVKNTKGAERVTQSFFQKAVEYDRWHLAMHVEAQHRAATANSPTQLAMFWINVSDIPRLLDKCFRLRDYLQTLISAGTVNPEIHLFCARFFKEGLAQEILARHNGDTQTTLEAKKLHEAAGRLRHLFAQLKYLGADQVQFIDQVLLSLTRDPKRYPPRVIHHLVARIYNIYWNSAKSGFWLSEETLTCLLRHTCEALNTKSRVGRRATNLDIDLVVRQYRRLYKVLSKEAVSALIQNFTYAGALGEVDKWIDYLKEHYPGYENLRPCLWATVYVHGRRSNLTRALDAFNRVTLIAKENGQQVDVKTWNVLIYARSRVDDLQGALEDLVKMIESDVQPDKWTYHSILEMMADRGDATGIAQLIEDFRTRSKGRPSVAHYGSLMGAYIKRRELDKAETVLKTTVEAVLKSKTMSGTLTFMFERLMAGYAKQADPSGVEKVLKWMQQLGIRSGSATYGALMAAMISRRQSPGSLAILTREMKARGVRPTAGEYATQMKGFNRQQMYDDTVKLHETMQLRNIRQSVDSQVMYLHAKTELERRKNRRGDDPKQPELTEAIAELRGALELDTGKQIAGSSSLMSVWPRGNDSAVAAYFEHLIHVHGEDEMFNAVRELVELYIGELRTQGLRGTTRTASLRTLSALMTAHLKAKNYQQVEKLWYLAKQFADRMTPDMSLADRGPPSNILDLDPRADEHDEEKYEEAVQIHSSATVVALRPSAGRAMWLTGVLARYLRALADEGRVSDMLDLVPAVTVEGYKLDSRTWNWFIRFLCELNPPFVLLAFTLTERFLMPGFGGWAVKKSTYGGTPKRDEVKHGVQYMRKRYLAPQDVAPEYPTLVMLSWALKQLRRLETHGGQKGGPALEKEPGLALYVGDSNAIKSKAPRTFLAMRKIPRLPRDPLQIKLFHSPKLEV